MNPNEEDIIVSENDAEETVNEPELEEESETEEPKDSKTDSELEELRKKVKTLEVQKDKWRQKATSKESTPSGDLSYEDIIALQEAKVSKDDLKEVKRYAEFEGVSISEALNSDILKTVLSKRTEERTSSEALNTGSSRRSSRKLTDEALLSNAKKGVLPEDESDLVRLVKLQRGIK